MDFRELRIGSVISLGNRVAKIACFEGIDMAVCYDLEETQDTIESCERISPEILTEEWFIKFGYECIQEFIFDMIDKSKHPVSHSIAHWAASISELHVNELQNLFQVLTGEELEIKEG